LNGGMTRILVAGLVVAAATAAAVGYRSLVS
jgi:hypothetical protein